MALWLHISITNQQLKLMDGQNCLVSYSVCTAKNGPGELKGSECTPRGWHYIRAKIGAGQPINTVFKGRRPTGEIYTAALHEAHPGRDWILTRILWLCGLEKGENRFGEVDTMSRYIYFHGSPPERFKGKPSSRGCICLRNEDMLEVFDRVPVYTKVLIE